MANEKQVSDDEVSINFTISEIEQIRLELALGGLIPVVREMVLSKTPYNADLALTIRQKLKDATKK